MPISHRAHQSYRQSSECGSKEKPVDCRREDPLISMPLHYGFIQRWREGHIGHFMLDNVNEDTLKSLESSANIIGTSISQGRKAEKDQRRERVRVT